MLFLNYCYANDSDINIPVNQLPKSKAILLGQIHHRILQFKGLSMLRLSVNTAKWFYRDIE